MFGHVLSTVGKVLHEVLLEISEVFFTEPSILHKHNAAHHFPAKLLQEHCFIIGTFPLSPVNPGAPAVVPVFSAAAE